MFWNKKDKKPGNNAFYSEDELKGKERIVMDKAVYLLKEIPFFKAEVYILLAGSFLAVILGLLAFTGFTEETFYLYALVALLASVWGVWLIKYLKYMPRGKKHLGIKFFKNGLASLFCEELADGNKIRFNNSLAPTIVTNLRAHTEMTTGRPFIMAFESFHKNINVSKLLNEKVDDRSSEYINAALEDALEQGIRKERLKHVSPTSKLKDPVMIAIGIIGIILIGYIFFIAWPQTELLETIAEQLGSMKGSIGGLKSAVASSAENVVVGGA